LRRRILHISSLIILVISFYSVAFGQSPSKVPRKARALQLQELSSSIEGAAGEPMRTFKTKEGYLRFLGAPASTHFAVEPDKRGTARQTADAFIEQWRNLFVKDSPAVEFSINRTNSHESRSYVHYRQMYAGLPIRSAEVIVQVNAQGGIDAVMSDIMRDTEFLDAGKLSFITTIDALTAQGKAIGFFAAQHPQIQFETSAAILMIYVPSVIGRSGDPQLVWETEVSNSSELVRELVLVDAHAGDIAFHYSLICYAMAPREIYDYDNGLLLRNDEGYQNEPWPTEAPSQELVDLTWDYLGKTQQFYWDVHHRYGIDDANMTSVAKLEYGYVSAYWWPSGEHMVFGYGLDPGQCDCIGHLVQDDCVGHEFTHGVTQHTSGLETHDESGAINEAFSDAWGEWIDLNDYDADDLSEKRWWFDEDYYLTSQPYRDMQDPPQTTCWPEYNYPEAFPRPDRLYGDNWYYGSADYGGVHNNSGVGNKLCYLITDGSADDPSGGGTFNGHTVSGMGIVPAARLFYQCQFILPQAAEYYDLYYALTQAAIDINNPKLSWSERVNIKEACEAVEICPLEDTNDWGLVGYWMLDEGSGQIAYDSSIYENNGILGDSNTVEDSDPNWFEDTVHGWCLHFDGGDKVSLSCPIQALEGSNVTISAWIKTYAVATGQWYPIVTQCDNYGYYLYLSGNKAAFYLNGSASAKSAKEINVGEWYHLAGTYNNFQLKIYVNGSLEGTLDLEDGYGADTDAYIGYAQVGNDYFIGYIDDVRIYNYVLDADEIWELSYISPADFDKDEFVNFIDYAMFANAWQSSTGQPYYNDIFDLADNNSIDYNDLALFCKDWLWVASWTQSMESMMMGLGMGQSVSFTEGVYTSPPVEQKQSEQINQLDIEEMLKWLAEVWLDPEVQEAIDEAEWLKFIESLKSELE